MASRWEQIWRPFSSPTSPLSVPPHVTYLQTELKPELSLFYCISLVTEATIKQQRRNDSFKHRALIKQMLLLWACLLIAQDNPECEGYAILSMAITDGEEPNQRGSQEMKCLPALSLEEQCDGTWRRGKWLASFFRPGMNIEQIKCTESASSAL